jgi:hypothetical protein
VDVSRVHFIPPALPKLRAFPPTGEGWMYELKFDGYRVQLHKAGLSSAIYDRNGGDFTRRFPTIAATVLALPKEKQGPFGHFADHNAQDRDVAPVHRCPYISITNPIMIVSSTNRQTSKVVLLTLSSVRIL